MGNDLFKFKQENVYRRILNDIPIGEHIYYHPNGNIKEVGNMKTEKNKENGRI